MCNENPNSQTKDKHDTENRVTNTRKDNLPSSTQMTCIMGRK